MAPKSTSKKSPAQVLSVEDLATRAVSLLESEDHAGAAAEADRALENLPHVARAALTRGQALLHPALTELVTAGVMPSVELLDEKPVSDAERQAESEALARDTAWLEASRSESLESALLPVDAARPPEPRGHG